jgi:membrane protein involved in colicin uptake
MKFYSEKLNKLFDTEKELKAAETEVAEAEAKKAEEAKTKKAEAKVVEDAFKARNAARREYNTKVVEARKIYNAALAEAKKAFNDAITAANTAKDKAEEAYNTALTDFTTKHKEGFHITLKDGDNVMTVSSQGDTSNDVSKEYTSLLDHLLNFWKL